MIRVKLGLGDCALRQQAFVPVECDQSVIQVCFCQQKLIFALQHLLGPRAAFDLQVVLVGACDLGAGLSDGLLGGLNFQRVIGLRLGNFGDVRRDIRLGLADIGFGGPDIGL